MLRKIRSLPQKRSRLRTILRELFSLKYAKEHSWFMFCEEKPLYMAFNCVEIELFWAVEFQKFLQNVV